MALTVGTDTLITQAEADAIGAQYFDAPAVMGEPAIRRAFLYLKSLQWRAGLFDDGDAFPDFAPSVPDEVKAAQGILAQYEAVTPNGLQPNVVPGQQKVLTRVGEIGWQVTGQTGVDAQRAVVTMADDLLKPYLQAKSNFLLRG